MRYLFINANAGAARKVIGYPGGRFRAKMRQYIGPRLIQLSGCHPRSNSLPHLGNGIPYYLANRLEALQILWSITGHSYIILSLSFSLAA